jgi:hypothetical protein
MEAQRTLIARLRARFPDDTDKALGARCGLSKQRWHNYATGKRHMDPDAVLGLCKAAGEDPARWVPLILMEAASTPRERHFWERLASAAVFVLVAVGVMLHSTAEARTAKGYETRPVYTLCALRRWLASLRARALVVAEAAALAYRPLLQRTSL